MTSVIYQDVKSYTDNDSRCQGEVGFVYPPKFCPAPVEYRVEYNGGMFDTVCAEHLTDEETEMLR